jgi:uroporphyrinogen decarboxylase
MLTHRERLQACLSNDSALDRPPVILWRHFPVDDQNPELLARATLDFQRTYDFDMVKVTPASSFCIKDWGAEDAWEGHLEGTRRYTKRVIKSPHDWENLSILDPLKTEHLAKQITCLRILRKELGPEIPLVQTIFDPLSQAKNLAGNSQLIVHLRQYPNAVMNGLRIIAETTRRFLEICLSTGIDGIFFAVQHAQAGLLTKQEFIDFGLSLDLQILDKVQDLWINLLHLHGEEIYFDLASSFNCQIVNWHDRETSPTLSSAKTSFPGVLCGGVSQKTITYSDNAEVLKESLDAISKTDGRRFILGTGCVVPIIAPQGNIRALRQSVENN